MLDNICIYDYSGRPFFNVISLDQPEVRLCLDILHFQCSIQNIGVTMLSASVLKWSSSPRKSLTIPVVDSSAQGCLFAALNSVVWLLSWLRRTVQPTARRRKECTGNFEVITVRYEPKRLHIAMLWHLKRHRCAAPQKACGFRAVQQCIAWTKLGKNVFEPPTCS